MLTDVLQVASIAYAEATAQGSTLANMLTRLRDMDQVASSAYTYASWQHGVLVDVNNNLEVASIEAAAQRSALAVVQDGIGALGQMLLINFCITQTVSGQSLRPDRLLCSPSYDIVIQDF